MCSCMSRDWLIRLCINMHTFPHVCRQMYKSSILYLIYRRQTCTHCVPTLWQSLFYTTQEGNTLYSYLRNQGDRHSLQVWPLGARTHVPLTRTLALLNTASVIMMATNIWASVSHKCSYRWLTSSATYHLPHHYTIANTHTRTCVSSIWVCRLLKVVSVRVILKHLEKSASKYIISYTTPVSQWRGDRCLKIA